MSSKELLKLENFINSQEKPVFILVMGISGSGKTELAKEISERTNVIVFSFDGLRKELERNELFDIGYNEIVDVASGRARKILGRGENVIFVSAGLNGYRRRHFLKAIKDVDCIKICVIKFTDFDTCVKRQLDRPSPVEEDIIFRQYEAFQIPNPIEGWNYIIRFTENNGPSLKEIIEQTNDEQNLKISYHMEIATQLGIDRRLPPYLVNAIRYHDIGKFYSQVEDNYGENSYPHHENISAYLYALNSIDDSNWIYTSNLILWHENGKNLTPDKLKKFQNRFGQRFTNDIILISSVNKDTKM